MRIGIFAVLAALLLSACSDPALGPSGAASARITPPLPLPLSLSLEEDTTLTARVSAHGQQDRLRFGLHEAPRHGRVELGADGRFSYVPVPNFHGEDSFVFAVCDAAACAHGQAVLTVRAVNDVPEAGDDEAWTTEERSIHIDVRSNDADVDDARADLRLQILDTVKGRAESTASGIQFTPEPDFIGEAQIRYALQDSAGAVSNPATVAIHVAPGMLRAGVAKGRLRVPVGAPLGGYLRPPLAGDYIVPFEDEDPHALLAELADVIPYQADDGTPLAPVPDELRTLHAPYTTVSAPSRGYYDSLLVKAVALHDGSDWLVLVRTDLIGMLDEVVQAVADQVQQRTGIALHDALILSATHTHDGPGAIANHSTRYFWFAMDVYQPALFQRLVDDIATVVIQATADLVPARIGHGSGQEQYRNPLTGGWQQLNRFRRARLPHYDAAGNEALRRRIGVLRIDHADGQPLAVIMNYAAHGIAFGIENLLFSGDVLAAAEREVELSFATPVVAMLVQSTGGDVSPSTGSGPTLQRIERFGKLLAPQVRDIYDRIVPEADGVDVRVVSQRVLLSRAHLGYGDDEYPYPWGAVQCNADLELGRSPGCIAAPPPDAADLADNGVGENAAFVPQDTRVTVARIGELLLMAQPGEPLTEYGLRLLHRAADLGFPPEHAFIWGYSQDHLGYILAPEKADWEMGETEGTTSFWGWKLGDRLLDASSELILALRDGRAGPADEFVPQYQYAKLPVISPPALPSAAPGLALVQPRDIERLARTVFRFEGGDPVVDLPDVALLSCDAQGETCVPARRANGEAVAGFHEMHLEYELVSGRHVWLLRFEAPYHWPVGTYRFSVQGQAWQAGLQPYALRSAPFAVRPLATLRLGAPVVVDGQIEVTLAYPPMPENYRLIDPHQPVDQPAPVRQGSVSFQQGDHITSVVTPSIEIRSGRLAAVYRAPLRGSLDALRLHGEDIWGNTTPPPPASDS